MSRYGRDPMSSLAGPFFAAVVLLAVAGAVKVLSPDATRVALRSAGLPSTRAAATSLGVVELAVASAALIWGGALPAAAVAVAYLGFAGFSAVVRSRSKGQASCGCFGASDAPLGLVHVAIDLALAAVAVALVVDPIGNVWTEAANTPWAGVPLLALVALVAWLVQVSLTLLPELWAARHPDSASSSTASVASPRPLPPKVAS